MTIILEAGSPVELNIQLIPTQVPTVVLISPVGGEVWTIGETYNILWEASGIDVVELCIRLWLNGTIHTYTIVRMSPSPGVYAWTIPTYLEPGTRYTVRIDAIDVSAHDQSDFLTLQ